MLCLEIFRCIGAHGDAFACRDSELDLGTRLEALAPVALDAQDCAGLPEPTIAVETDSLSLKLATLRMTDCLGLTTTQILTQEEAHGIVALDHEALQFRREAGIICRRHADLAPSVKLVIAELRKIAAKNGPN